MPRAWAATITLATDFQRGVQRLAAGPGHAVGQALSVQHLHYDVGRARRERAKVEDLDDAAMADTGRRARLVEEALDHLVGPGQLGVQHLDRHAAAERRVRRQVNRCHASLTETLNDLVVTDAQSDHRGFDYLESGKRAFFDRK
jgi:hypothetical protein